MGYYGFFFRKFGYFNLENKKLKSNISLSVIIACKNEAENLEQNLPFLLSQKNVNFEIILINDASTDHSTEIIQQFTNRHSNIKCVSIPFSNHYQGNKKNALNIGIQNAKYEHLVFTDADCKPASPFWLDTIANTFEPNVTMVLGYGQYEKNQTWLNKLIRYETLLAAWQYFSYSLHHLSYMGVGRNMAYTQTLFKKLHGFENHIHIKSGDDDLFINQCDPLENIAITWQKNSHTISKPKTSFSAWFRQKRRHITTSFYYKNSIKFLLALFYLSQVAFYSLFIALILFYPFSLLVIFIVFLRFIAYYYTLIPVAKKLNESDLVYIAPVLELNLILLQGIIFIVNVISKPKSW